MKTWTKRLWGRRAALVVALVAIVAGLQGAALAADSAPERQNVIEVAPGVVYWAVDVPSRGGTARAHVIQVDLTNPNVSLDLLYPGVVAAAQPLSQMVEASGAVAAVNADFFNISATQPGVVPTNAPVGPAIAGGVTLKAAVPTAQRFGPSLPSGATVEDVIGVGEDGIARLDRLTLHGEIVTPSGTYPLAGLNQYAIAQGGIAAFNSLWGSTSRGRTVCGNDRRREDPCSTNVYEVTVADGRVVSVSNQPGSGRIPEGTLVLIGREAGADRLRSLQVGDPVTVTYELRSASGRPLRFAAGGQPLVRDGRAVPGLDNATVAIRSGAGISADGRTLHFFALDGAAAGMTYAEVAAFLLSLGAYSGINLDGGGSSTLVVRLPGDGSVAVMNRPAAEQRPIPNGIGVFVAP